MTDAMFPLDGSVLARPATGGWLSSWRARLRWARPLVRSRARAACVARTTQLLLEANTARTVLVAELPFRVTCIEGCIWITHPADQGDHVLADGGEFTASGTGDLVVMALETSRLVPAHAGRGVGGLVLV